MPLYIATKIIMLSGCDLMYVYSNVGVMLKRVNFHGHLERRNGIGNGNWKRNVKLEMDVKKKMIV